MIVGLVVFVFVGLFVLIPLADRWQKRKERGRDGG